jgi:E-phenylitaconyl-CoA hydratase
MALGEAVKYEVRNHVAWIILNRPDKRNAINFAMRQEVQEAFTDVKYNLDVWVAVISAEGTVFCAGKDLKETPPDDDGSIMNNDELYLFQRGIYKPFICAINGPCFAQGGGFAMNSDIIIMAEGTSIGWPQVKRGISSVSGPCMGIHALPWAKAMEYLLRGKPMPAEECLQFGLANEIVPRADLMTAAERWAAEICECAPIAVRGVKEAACRGMDLAFEDRVKISRDICNRVLLSEDSKEGILAFKDKRDPVWTGR